MKLTSDFDKAVTKILSVSHKELKRREVEWKKQRRAKKMPQKVRHPEGDAK